MFWERSRYEWSEPGVVKAVVTDSDVIKPGSTSGLRAVPVDGGTEVEMTLHRTFKKGPGRIGATVNHVSGNRGWHSCLAEGAVEYRARGPVVARREAGCPRQCLSAA